MKKLILVILFLFHTISTLKSNSTSVINNECLSLDTKFSNTNLIRYIKQSNLKHKHIVYAQAILETGNFKSKIFKENNNLFGMKYVHDFNQRNKRVTTAIGSKHNHAVYSNWKLSVDDYILWQKMFKVTPIETEYDYFNLLESRYAEDKSYLKILNRILKQDTIKWK